MHFVTPSTTPLQLCQQEGRHVSDYQGHWVVLCERKTGLYGKWHEVSVGPLVFVKLTDNTSSPCLRFIFKRQDLVAWFMNNVGKSVWEHPKFECAIVLISQVQRALPFHLRIKQLHRYDTILSLLTEVSSTAYHDSVEELRPTLGKEVCHHVAGFNESRSLSHKW